MSGDELRTRLAQELHKRADLLRHKAGLRPAAIRLHDPSSRGKFFFERGEAASRAKLLLTHLPIEAAAIVREADEICAHRFRLLGYENLVFSDKDGAIDWHLDPVHGKRAPLIPCFKIPFLEFAAVGDHKVTWELNRHQHLVTLAKAWLLTREDKYVGELTAQWRNWIESNPYPLGINWGSTLEVAFRSLSWIWVDHLLAEAPAYAEFRAELLSALAFHGRYIERYLSTYFSPNTHLLGEAAAMFFLGTLYPQMPHAARWKKDGWNIVVREAGRQVRPDGVYFEQSLYYHVYALDFFLHARTLAAANNIQIPPAFDDVLRKMLNVIAALAQAGPAEGFGDDDGGRLFNPRRNQTENMTDPLAIGALAFRRDGLPLAHLTEESIWLFGDRAVAALAPKDKPSAGSRATAPPSSASAPASTAALPASSRSAIVSAAFPDGGIYVLADSSPLPQVMMIDAGPQGTGRCGHGHADALSLRLTIDGSRWLVDSGSGVYISSDPAERNNFRGTAAHNTLRVDGLDQAVPAEPFSWRDIPAPQAENFVAGRTFTCFAGSHNGYARLADPVTHRRLVLRINGYEDTRLENAHTKSGRAESDGAHNDFPGSNRVRAGNSSRAGIWLVRDVMLGQAEHDLELNWHFASGIGARQIGPCEIMASKSEKPRAGRAETASCELQSSQPTLRMIWPAGTAWNSNVTEGRLSPAYGRYDLAPRVHSLARIKLPTEIATAFVVGESAGIAAHASMTTFRHGAAQSYELHLGPDKHEFIFSLDHALGTTLGSQARGEQPWSVGPWTSDAELLYCRMQNDKLAQLIVIGGTRVDWQGRPLLTISKHSKYCEWRVPDAAPQAESAPFATTALFDELTGNAPASNNASSMSSYAEKH